MQDRPTAAELLEAVCEFLEREVAPELEGRKRFHLRVTLNVLGILRRELELEEETVIAEWERLARLLEHPGPRPPSLRELRGATRELRAELARRIRAGEMDPRWEETLRAMRESVADKLRVANPGYAEADPDSSSSVR